MASGLETRGQVARTMAGTEGVEIKATIPESQVELALQIYGLNLDDIDYTKVVVMGPLRAWRWKYIDPGLPWPITGELWQRSDGARLFEVSIKVPVAQAAAATAGFMAFLAEVGAEREEGQQAKTRWAIEHAADQHRQTAQATT
jgi:hypothetical protein